MANVTDRDRYNIPVLEFLIETLQEEFPELNVNEGSAIYDTIVRPAALMMQPHRDYIRVLARNIKLRNHSVMDPLELASLAANFLVSPREGTRARGLQRVFFAAPQAVNVSNTSRFFDDAGLVFLPINTFSATQSQVESQVVASTGEFFVDVPVVAEAAGEEYSVGADTVRNVQGIQGATRTTNPNIFTAGKNSDSNTELYARVVTSITNRDLVKKNAISTALFEAFDSIRNIEVVGFGDPDMTRDIVDAVVALERLFSRSFCTKTNVPLDGNGDIKWYEDDGITLVTAPLGGWVGSVVDNVSLDYLGLNVSLDGVTFRKVAVQPGNQVRLFGENTTDPDIKDYLVRAVVDGPTEPGGADTRMLILREPFANVSEGGDDIATFPYTLLGAADTDSFHVGGKVDVYVDSVSTAELSVTIASLVVDVNSGDAEIPILSDVADSAGNSIFENQVGFQTPVLSIAAVEELDPASGVVLRTLVPDVNYVLVRQAQRGRFSVATSDILIIKGTDPTQSDTFSGSRMQIRYLHNADYAAIQSYVDNPANRDITKDILVFPPQIVSLDVAFDYRGSATEASIVNVVSEFIAEKSFGATITVNEIVSLLNFYGVTDITMPMTLTSRFDRGDGVVEVSQSPDRVSSSRVQVYVAADSLSIRRIG